MEKLLMRVLLVTLAIWSHSAFADGEVKLIRAKSVETHYRNYWHYGRFEAVVKNLAYSKHVSVSLKKTDGTWMDLPLAYNRSANAGAEVWAADFDTYSMVGTADPMEFAIKYQVNGKTYWDNNGSANYRLEKDSGNFLVGQTVYNANYRAQDYAIGPNYTTYGGVVTVKNLSPTKQIKVVYSTDGWQTSKTANAVFNANYWYWAYSSVSNPNEHGFEEWTFQMDVGNAPKVEYAIQYVVNEHTSHWDNNFGRNYTTTLLRP